MLSKPATYRTICQPSETLCNIPRTVQKLAQAPSQTPESLLLLKHGHQRN